MIRDKSALLAIRSYLDETMYALVDFRVGFEAPITPTGFPKFELLDGVVSRLDAPHRTLFRLLRLGESVDAGTVTRFIPSAVLDALVRTALLVRTDDGAWRTPDLLLVPIEGVLVLVGIPPSYPTASKPCDVWFDLSSYVVAKALPGSLRGERVLDLCSGSGVQSLICAIRGTTSALGLDVSAEAVEIARVNAILNDVEDRVAFAHSDRLAALRDGERFDFIICNTPYAPVTDGAIALDSIGNSVLLSMLDRLPDHLSERGRGIVATWRSPGAAGSTFQRDRIAARFAEAGLDTLAFVDRAPDTVEGVLRILQGDVAGRLGADEAEVAVATTRGLLESGGVDGFYNQLLLLTRTTAGAGQSIFGLALE